VNRRQSWKTLGTVLLVFLGGMSVILFSFAMLGFPFPRDPIPQIALIELVLLLILLGIPLLR
jgi:hypothetical protein